MPATFSGNFLELSGGRKVYYAHSKPAGPATGAPIVAIHGLGGSSSFWIPALQASGLLSTREAFALDQDGHGLSDFSGRENMSITDYVADLEAIIEALGLKKVVLMGHSMNGTITSLFTQKHPDMVDQLILLNPVRNLSDAARENMRKRAKAASTREGLVDLANTVAVSGVSKYIAASDPSATAFIRHLVSSTNLQGYAAACGSLATIPSINGADLPGSLLIIGGEEDYSTAPKAIREWAAEVPNGRGKCVLLKNVGHWGAIEAPFKVGKALARAPPPTNYSILMGTFRDPLLYTLNFDTISGKLELQHTNKATAGHNWLDVRGDVLYATNWGEDPSISCYSIIRPSADKPFPTVKPLATVGSKYLSGYVVANGKAVYSACGPQVDVFLLDDKTGAIKDQPPAQSFALVSEEDMHKGNSQMDFGGLRHGGHSADLSPDGTKLYVADIGRNCIWMYHVDTETGLLTEASKNTATRPDDGPRHVWPHPNGRLVYSLQEHTSMVDVFRLSDDDQKLEFVEGASIIPPGESAKRYWADEVRLSPDASVLFGSTRGLEPKTKGWVTAWRLSPDGRILNADAAAKGEATHRFETRTSGGWANAIAVCSNFGPNGETFLTLTDSEEGFVQVLSYLPESGFKVVDEVKVGNKDKPVGASVTVWL